jgi:tetratricopeptide (TPR) repeat protein
MSSTRLDLHRFRDAEDPGGQAQVWLEASRVLAEQGEEDEARRLSRAAVELDPGCADAWLQLAWLARNREERRALLQQVLTVDPGNVRAAAELVNLQRLSQEPPQAAARSGKGQVWGWIAAALLLALFLALAAFLVWGPVDRSLAWLIATPTPTTTPTPTRTPAEVVRQFVPQLEAAQAAANWDRTRELIDIMVGVDPAGEEVARRGLETYLLYGCALVQEGQHDQAQLQFDRAVAFVPQDGAALLWQQTTQHYRAGWQAFQAGEWAAAIASFKQAYELMPDYSDLAERLTRAYLRAGQAASDEKDWTAAIEVLTEAHQTVPESATGITGVVDMLATAYRQRGMDWQAQDKLQKARADLEAALALRPDDAEAQTHLDQVMYILFPPKRIEINLSTQRFYAWLGDTLIYNFPTSTGLPGRNTAAGRYKVLDKIPMAYSSVWNLTMPYWLGIYYVGPIENGIHALPIRPDGTVMWGGLLGQQASYGCVILSTEAARIIYNWAEIGTSVHIHY